MASPARTLQVVKPETQLNADAEPPRGDPQLTVETMQSWSPGQRLCRGRKRHNWLPFMVYEHRDRFDVVERCSHCRNRRAADYVPTARGLRKVTDWKPDYRDGYLLPKGAARIDEDLHDELTAADILSRKRVEVADEPEGDDS